MSNRRDIEPSLDYFELKRRHEEYKNSQRQTTGESDGDLPEESVPKRKPRNPAESVAEEARDKPAAEAEDIAADPTVEEGPEDLEAAGEALGVADQLPEDDFEGEDYDDEADDEPASDDPNPFDSFIRAKTPAGRWGEAEDLGGPAVFLASDASNFVNGHILYVDGGILAYIGKQPS